MSDSHSDEDGVIGYQATTVTPAIMQPMAAAALPSIRILPAVSFIGSIENGSCLVKVRVRVVPAGLERARVQRDRLGLLPELLAERLLHQRQVDAEQLRQDAVVDHVAHEAAQLGVGTDRRDQLVERHRVEHEVVAQRVQLQRLVVDDRRARLERQHVFLRRLRVHRDEEVDFLLPRDVAALAGPDRVPGRAARRCSTGTCSCPTTGTPISRIDRSRTMLAVWLPEPLTVAT